MRMSIACQRLRRTVGRFSAWVATGGVCAGGVAHFEPCVISPPPPVREFRAAWIATVGNIDWPSTNALTTAQQKAELLAILDRASRLKLNAVIFQVRPACDALYASKIEPWSEYLTGTMGRAPEPYYDPLAFAIEEAHKRGLELHAWFNPYRARFSGAKSPIAANHIAKTHPQLVRRYGPYLWLDPGEKQVQDYSLNVVMDVVKRYDVDGVHFDDYFYPYKEKDVAGNPLDFPDSVSWRRFGARGKLGREDWRRQNVDIFVERVYRAIKARKPWVKFGISPFGIWRPLNPPTIRGLDAYAELYADSRKWLANGWVDYFAPQLYWPIDAPAQSFPVLLKWWANQNLKGRLLLAGLNSAKAGGPWQPEEIINQIRLARQQSGASGHVHWDMRSLMRNDSLVLALEHHVYAEPVLVPACPWLSKTVPAKPKLTLWVNDGSNKPAIRWAAAGAEKVSLWLVQTRSGSQWTTQILPGSVAGLVWSGTCPEVVVVSGVNRYGHLGAPAAAKILEGL